MQGTYHYNLVQKFPTSLLPQTVPEICWANNHLPNRYRPSAQQKVQRNRSIFPRASTSISNQAHQPKSASQLSKRVAPYPSSTERSTLNSAASSLHAYSNFQQAAPRRRPTAASAIDSFASATLTDPEAILR